MRVIHTAVYTIGEHPNRDACYQWIRENWHSLNDGSLRELIASMEALSERLGGSLDYSVSTVPSRGEYISFSDYDRDALSKLDADKLPLTGFMWDRHLINGLLDGNPASVLKILHRDTEHIYSDEGLFDLCTTVSYEFKENGEAL